MVEYGSSNLVTREQKRKPPTVFLGITFGEVSYLDYKPDSKLKVSQDDLLIFFRQLAVILQSGVPLAQGIELLAENTKNEKFAALQLQMNVMIFYNDTLYVFVSSYARHDPIMIATIYNEKIKPGL